MKIKNIFIITVVVLLVILVGYNLWPETGLSKNTIADKLVVYKSKRVLELWSRNNLIKVYPISLGGNPIGHKITQGDSKTPEGIYFIDSKNPKSQFHLNLGISYPNKKDRENSSNPGGDIKIHGLRNGIGFLGKYQRVLDWTDGCIAVTNPEIEELYDAVPIGTEIVIKE